MIHASISAEISASEREHTEFVRKRAGECMVLLRNNGILPLSQPGKVALFGNGARATVKGGTGSGDVNSRFVVNIETGLEEAGFTVTTKSWLDNQEALMEKIDKEFDLELKRLDEEEHKSSAYLALCVKNVPKEIAPVTDEMIKNSDTDTAIYVLARNSGEGNDRKNEPGDYQLLPGEVEILTKLGENYKNVIVLLNVGGIIDEKTIENIPGISAVVFISQSGNVGGNVVADVLLGNTSPSGRLTDTWAVNYEDYSSSAGFSHNNGNCDDEFYSDGIFVGYRYFDTFNVEPLYPFGYGLNYTQFSHEVTGVNVENGNITITTVVKNIGEKFNGREVIQVYGSAPKGKLEKPFQVLCGFGKTKNLKPGDSQELTVTFPVTNLESYDPETAAYVLEKGKYFIRVGTSSRNTKVVAAIEIDEDIITKKVRNICPVDIDFKEITSEGVTPWSYETENEEKANAPIFKVNSGDVETKTVTYSGEPEEIADTHQDHVITLDEVREGKFTFEELVAQLTVQEMAKLTVGIAGNNGDDGSVIGAGAKAVPGAAGETFGGINGRDIKAMINADGPAGLRLTPHFIADKDGNPLPGGGMLGKIFSPLPEKREGDFDCYQYCTAIPIATLLASSWDLELIKDFGDLVGAELSQFGVHTWLAPGMNIHRNPLCGRNFEYYSEDPLLSGLCATADVRGVQKHPGIGTSIKHFCLNNQEEYRFGVNAHIKERALREIYLRNFSVAIMGSQPMTIMTSYNLINGVHAANCYDTITSFAREECGFEGYVMTDWYTSDDGVMDAFMDGESKYSPSSSATECIRTGNDLQMPGSPELVEQVANGVETGAITKAMLQQCALRIIKVCAKCSCFDDAESYSKGMELKNFVVSK